MRNRGSARGCWGALVILRELPDRGLEWFPSNVARNSHACILGFEIRSLELQRLWPISKNDRIKLRATFGGVVTWLFAFKGVGGVGIPRSGGGSVGGSFGG